LDPVFLLLEENRAMSDEVTLTVYLTPNQAECLAQLVKRITWNDV